MLRGGGGVAGAPNDPPPPHPGALSNGLDGAPPSQTKRPRADGVPGTPPEGAKNNAMAGPLDSRPTTSPAAPKTNGYVAPRLRCGADPKSESSWQCRALCPPGPPVLGQAACAVDATRAEGPAVQNAQAPFWGIVPRCEGVVFGPFVPSLPPVPLGQRMARGPPPPPLTKGRLGRSVIK